MKKLYKRIGVLTSGGDAPGMNACIRAVVRSARNQSMEIYGFQRGWYGLLESSYQILSARSVSNIIQRGGTMLKTSRCPEFLKQKFRNNAVKNLKHLGVEALIVIGGDGSFRGCQTLYQEFKYPIIGIPGTIDNDIYGSDETIGFDTAINTALGLIDKIRDTAASHERVFLVEVMGRQAGFIALMVGLAGGAEWIFVPEINRDIEEVVKTLVEGQRLRKSSSIVVVAEGDEQGGAYEIAKKLEACCDFPSRVCVLGHTQRGGSPSARDRILATRLGHAAVDALLNGEKNKMVGEVNGKINLVPLNSSYTRKKSLDKSLYKLSGLIA